MILRPRQQQFVTASLDALKAHASVLGVAPTGAGKTVMLSAVATRFDRILVLQHRDELTSQNLKTFRRFGSPHTVGIVDGTSKAFGAAATFAMVPTLCREASLERMKPVDLVVIDEAHHATAATYRKILHRAQQLNPAARIYGVTATPNRGDGTGLHQVFGHVADQITIQELIQSGHLVPPRCYVIDIGISDKLANVHKTRSGEYDMDEVGELLDGEVVSEEIYQHWREKAGNRQTVVFAPTVAYAHRFADLLRANGVAAEALDGETDAHDRARILRDIGTGRLQVLVNVAVATEGWDCPPVSCVVLLRPSSYKSTMMQMVGRGLRVCTESEWPGVVKTDCVVLDFGRSLLRHKSLLQIANLRGNGKQLQCNECGAVLPPYTEECPLCGAELYQPEPLEEDRPEGKGKEALSAVKLVEFDPFTVVEASPFAWHSHNERVVVASGFGVAVVAFQHRGVWHSCAIEKSEAGATTLTKLVSGTQGMAISAADDWMRGHASVSEVGKSKRWLREPMTDKQREHLRRGPTDFSLNRYAATCELTIKWNKDRILRAYGIGPRA